MSKPIECSPDLVAVLDLCDPTRSRLAPESYQTPCCGTCRDRHNEPGYNRCEVCHHLCPVRQRPVAVAAPPIVPTAADDIRRLRLRPGGHVAIFETAFPPDRWRAVEVESLHKDGFYTRGLAFRRYDHEGKTWRFVDG